MHDDEWVWRNTRSSQTNDDKIDIFCFSAKFAPLRSIRTYYMYVVWMMCNDCFVVKLDHHHKFAIFYLYHIMAILLIGF